MKETVPNISCFQVESLLLKLVQLKKMTIDKYFAIVLKLLKAKYYCVFFDFNFIFYYLNKNHFSETEDIIFLQELLSSDAYIKNWTISLLTDLIINTILVKEGEIEAITFVLKWVNSILKKRTDFNTGEIILLFKSLYTAIPNENVRQIIYQILLEQKD